MITNQAKIVVTGATGFLGKRIATRLIEDGFPVRALVRRLSNVGGLKTLGVEIASGDLGDYSSIVAAFKGMDVVVHAAAGTSGTSHDSDIATIQGTRNVLEACRANRVKKLIYISSCSVYEVAGYSEDQFVDEEAQLERFPLRRGHYSAAKLQAEALVTKVMKRGDCPTVVLRPGTIYGPGSEVYTNMMGVSIARRVFIVFGDGKSGLPLVHVDNAVDAVVACIDNNAAVNQVFNVVDKELITKKMYMERVVKALYPNATMIYLPMSLLLALTWLQEKLLVAFGKQPFLTVYRLMSSQKRIRYDISKIQNLIGWRSHIGFAQGAEQLVREHERLVKTESQSVVP